jgi:hypothetical protein
MSDTTNESLIREWDEFLLELREEVKASTKPNSDGTSAPKIGFVDKLKLFEAGGKWVQVRNKVDPEESVDEFAKARDKFNGRTRGGGSAHSKANGAA